MKSPRKSRFFSNLKRNGKRWFASAVEAYGIFDHRSVGLARIGLGLLLLYNLWRRVPQLSTWYSNDGLLPNHILLWRPMFEFMFSFFFAASQPGEAAVMFVVCGFIFAMFTIGYRTRLFHVLSMVCLVSVQTRQAFTMNGGDVALTVLCFWTMFLPMGARFSVDAMRASLAERQEKTADELNDRAAFARAGAYPTASLAYFAILLQLAVIYYFNAVNKHGWTWRQGSAIHYVLYQERMVTWFGALVRDHLNLRMAKALTFTTLILEYAAPILILSPVGKVWLRRLAWILLPLLHLGFAAFLNLGQFSFNMIGYFPLLVTASDWSWFNRYLAPGPGRGRTVHVREDSPLQFGWARLLSRLDSFQRLRFVSGPAWEVEDPVTNRRSKGARAFGECLAALPCGLPFAAALQLPAVRALAEWLGRLIGKREASIGRWLRSWPFGGRGNAMGARPSAARTWFRRRPLAILREFSVAVVIFACTNQLFVQNNAIPKRFKPTQPKWITQLIWYPRLDQGWQMFSPDVPTGEKHLYIDAITFGGRHVDPFNEAGSRAGPVPLERIPPHLHQDEFWYDYEREIFGNEPYWRALKEWIFNYHVRTGNYQDRIISFEAKIIEMDAPPPGQTAALNPRTKVMFSARE
ncbi:MAG TPA: HTTM domain-containing protein [Polyangiaceae bacterium]